MTLGDTRVIHSIQCKFMRKGAASATTPRPATVTVTPGKISVVAHDGKFSPFTLKTTDFMKPPKAPGGKNSLWLALDCVQHVQAKFLYVNFMVDANDMSEVVETLLFAWSGNEINSSSLFADDDEEMKIPIHKPPSNKSAQPSVGVGRRPNITNRFSVDPEGSAAHQSFRTDFNASKVQQTKPVQQASKLQGLFDSSVQEEVKPVAVHKSTGLSKLAQEPAAKHLPKKSNSECGPSVAKKAKLSDRIEAVKEYKEIEKEFIILAEKVFRLEKKGREDVVNLMKEIVEDAVKNEELRNDSE